MGGGWLFCKEQELFTDGIMTDRKVSLEWGLSTQEGKEGSVAWWQHWASTVSTQNYIKQYSHARYLI